MEYANNDYYPTWVPEDMRPYVDRSELAKPNELIVSEANILMKKLDVNIAVYDAFKNGTKQNPNGLCSLFEPAPLSDDKLDVLINAERKLKNCIIVAYANPIHRRRK